MERVITDPRQKWQEHAENAGFAFHTMHGEPYWNEGVHYEFSLDQVENHIEDPSTELHAMCMDTIADNINNEYFMERLAIPEQHRDYVKNSWYDKKDLALYGRFDLIYDGINPAKMIEYNADTPTSLWEASIYQHLWLGDAKDKGILRIDADQFNMIHEKIVARMGNDLYIDGDFYFSSFGGVQEDYACVEYLGYCAREAGLPAYHINVEDISVRNNGQFVTKENEEIKTIFMLYPWEDMLRDEFAKYLPKSNTNWIEPGWKSLLSNKGLLPFLWDKFKGHPNLLEAHFKNEVHSMDSFVKKPIFSREGSSIEMIDSGIIIEKAEDMSYADNPMIIQEYSPIKNFDGNFPVIGAWIIGDECVGMGIREDHSRITQDLSRFTPHTIVN